jgi:hypothetical protein
MNEYLSDPPLPTLPDPIPDYVLDEMRAENPD